jgi:hypothetical protein
LTRMYAHLFSFCLSFSFYNKIWLIDYLYSRSNVAESNNDNRRNSQQLIGPQSIQVLKYEADLLQEQVCLIILNFENICFFVLFN